MLKRIHTTASSQELCPDKMMSQKL